MAADRSVADEAARGWFWLLGSLTLLGSFLLFLVQPIEGRRILPRFGGSAAVWTTTLLFFQTALLAGYGYSHLLSRIGSRRRQAIVHVALVLLSTPALPIVPGEASADDLTGSPIARILLLLTMTAGPPYLLLATTAPLLQRWATDLWPTRSPYRLYAVSNVAAIVALAAYPVTIEPAFGLGQQARLWAAGYVLFAAGILALGWRLTRVATDGAPAQATTRGRGGPAAPDGHVTLSPFVLWAAAAATGTTMLMAATNAMTDGVATFPFLWVWPLAVYLATFALAFSSDRAFHPTVLVVLFAAGCCYAAFLVGRPLLALQWSLVLHLGVLFVTCLALHVEVARSRPAPARLTAFYVAIAAGGAVGGAFVAVAAPLWFVDQWEYPIGITAAAALLAAFRLREWRLHDNAPPWARRSPVALAVVSILVLSVSLGWRTQADHAGVVAQYRNFFGLVEIQEGTTASGDAVVRIRHEGIDHGSQFVDPAARSVATTYYTPTSGVGIALLHAPAPGEDRRVGAVGLGAGTVAAYAEPGEQWTFYEINPRIADLAETTFTYLEDARARGVTVEVEVDDGRLALTRPSGAGDAGDAGFDLLVLDAFTGGAIPTHLLTREAFEVYWARMAPGGVIAVHISNRYVRLEPVMRGLAREFGLDLLIRTDQPVGVPTATASRWALLGDDLSTLARDAEGLLQPSAITEEVLWTDDRQNLWGILRLGR